jgi:hypothetical protein
MVPHITLTLDDVAFRYWLDELDNLVLDTPLDHNCDPDPHASPRYSVTELRALFDTGISPARAVAALLGSRTDAPACTLRALALAQDLLDRAREAA